MSETYLVTGGAGFIGSHIVDKLLRDGYTVRIVDNFSTGKRENIQHLLDNPDTANRLQVWELNVAVDDLNAAFEGVNYVFHEAALPSVPQSIKNPLAIHEHCVTATLRVLIAARDAGVNRVVYASSSAIYGDIDGEYTVEQLLPDPKSPYGAAKLFGEYYAKVFTEVYGIETVSLRYFNVFGPRQDPQSEYAAVIPKFITRMLAGQAPIIYGDGYQSRDFTYVDNIVHGNLLAAKAEGAGGKVMNLATAESIDLNTLVQNLNEIMGTDFAPVYEDERPGDIKFSKASTDLISGMLHYKPIVSFEDGLARTVNWFSERVNA